MGKRAKSYAEAPVLDLSTPTAARMEAVGVIENIMGSMIGSVRKELKDEREGRKVKPPTAKGYTALLMADLKARGFERRESER